jgi:hypothetical protein
MSARAARVLALAAALLCVAGAAQAVSYTEMLANTTVIPAHLLHNPFKGKGRALLAADQWDDFKKIGRYSEIANPEMSGEFGLGRPRCWSLWSRLVVGWTAAEGFCVVCVTFGSSACCFKSLQQLSFTASSRAPLSLASSTKTDRHSSTGQVAIHAALIPGTYKIILFGRNLPLSGPKSKPEPGVGGNVSTVYDVKVRDAALQCRPAGLFWGEEERGSSQRQRRAARPPSPATSHRETPTRPFFPPDRHVQGHPQL